MCICAQHEIVHAGGMGDLQKGERYVIYDQFGGEADNIVIGIVTWTTVTRQKSCTTQNNSISSPSFREWLQYIYDNIHIVYIHL